MTPLNDDEVNSLLEHAKSNPPEPRAELAVRILAAYHANVVPQLKWRSRFRQAISIPWPAALATAILLVVLGALLGRSLDRRSFVLNAATGEFTTGRNEVVPSGGTGGRQGSSTSASILSFKEFEPVSRITPHVVERLGHDR